MYTDARRPSLFQTPEDIFLFLLLPIILPILSHPWLRIFALMKPYRPNPLPLLLMTPSEQPPHTELFIIANLITIIIIIIIIIIVVVVVVVIVAFFINSTHLCTAAVLVF